MSNKKNSLRPKKTDIRLELGSKLRFLTNKDGLDIDLEEIAAALDIDSGNLKGYANKKPVKLEKLIGLLVLLNNKYAGPLTGWSPPPSLTPYGHASGPGDKSDEADSEFTNTSDKLEAFIQMAFDYLSKLTGVSPDELQRELENRIRDKQARTRTGS